MKKLLIIFSLVLAALAMVSCGSDKEDEPNFPNKTMTVRIPAIPVQRFR